MNNKLFLPISIIGAGLIVALAIFFTRGDGTGPTVVDNDGDTPQEFSIRPVSNDDHILGNPDAEIIIVEYSDFECPYCKDFHPIMEQVIEEYGTDGDVAWVFRHFPIDQIHKSARPVAEASECVADIGGNDKFWEFSSKTFANSPASLTSDALKTTALEIGIDEEAYQTCVDTRQFKDAVEEDFQDGQLIANSDPEFGTPYSILITKDGVQAPIRGAQQFSVIKQVIDLILSERN